MKTLWRVNCLVLPLEFHFTPYILFEYVRNSNYNEKLRVMTRAAYTVHIYFVILALDGKQCRKCFKTVAAIKRFTDKLMWDLKVLLYFQLSTVFSALVEVCNWYLRN